MSENGANSIGAEGAPTGGRWAVLPLPGLTLDVLGNYLASLGLLTLAARRWSGVRACWRGGEFLLIKGPANMQALVTEAAKVAESASWSNYSSSWRRDQAADTKKKTAAATGRWRSEIADELELELFQAHVVLADRLIFNPLFGSGGNAGRRDFAKGWQTAVTALTDGPGGKWPRERLSDDLSSFLCGNPCTCLGDFGAGSWFSAANEMYNSGTARPTRKGQVTPWAMALACEAFPLLQGNTSRRLGARRRSGGAFPFVTKPAAPESAGQAGMSVGEVWLPVWHRPMSVQEVSALFGRGRAEAAGRGVATAPAFAAAVLRRGVDAGIDEFRRFALIRTTSENTFESRLESVIPVRERVDSALAEAVRIALDLRDTLPADRKKGERWIYAGLRGPVDRALVDLGVDRGPVTGCGLVDALVAALRAVDLNRGHRKRGVRFRLLPGAWRASLLCEHESLGAEVRLALALASLLPTRTPDGSRQVTAPLLAYWLGAEVAGEWWTIREAVPLRRVWSGAGFAQNAAAVLQRRLIEEQPDSPPPFGGWAHVGLDEIEALLGGSLDEAELTRWLFRFSLFTSGQGAGAGWVHGTGGNRRERVVPAPVALFALFKPLFDARLIIDSIGARKPVNVGTARGVAALLARGDVDSAVLSATRAYRSVGVAIADFEGPFYCYDPARLLAALLVPVYASEVARVFERWRSPARINRRKETET